MEILQGFFGLLGVLLGAVASQIQWSRNPLPLRLLFVAGLLTPLIILYALASLWTLPLATGAAAGFTLASIYTVMLRRREYLANSRTPLSDELVDHRHAKISRLRMISYQLDRTRLRTLLLAAAPMAIGLVAILTLHGELATIGYWVGVLCGIFAGVAILTSVFAPVVLSFIEGWYSTEFTADELSRADERELQRLRASQGD